MAVAFTCKLVKRAYRLWVFRFKAANGERYMGLGPLHTVSLKEARDKALDCRKLRLAGIDPIEHRKTARLEAALVAARTMSFRQCAEAYIPRTAPDGATPSMQSNGKQRC